MSEYYALSKYARDKSNNEIYAQDNFCNQMYLNIGKDKVYQIFAKNYNNTIRYAQDGEKNFILPIQNNKPCYFFNGDQPLFPKNSQDIEIYAQFNSNEIYPTDGSREIYLNDVDGNQCYARDKSGQEYFASKEMNGERIQFYAKNSLLNDIPIFNKNGEIVYLINITQNRPLYPVEQEKECYLKIGKKEIYGRNLKNLPVYAKNKSLQYFARDENMSPYYGSYKEFEYYPTCDNGDQFYKVIEKKEIYAQRGIDKQFYAKNEQNDDILARSENISYYAQVAKNEIYPQVNNDSQYYKMDQDIEIPAAHQNGLRYYAKTNTNVNFYPMDFSQTSTEDSFEDD